MASEDTPPAEKLLTFPLAKVAERIPCSERWLTEQVRAGRIPGRKIGRHWRMTTADIEAALEAFRVAPAARAITARPNGHPMSLTPTSRRRM